MIGKYKNTDLTNLHPEIALHIGKNEATGIYISGQEEWVVITVQGNKRSLRLDDGEQKTFAMSSVVSDPKLELHSISEVVDFICQQLQHTGDTIVSMVKYNDGQKLFDIVEELLIKYSTDNLSFDVDDGGEAYADLAFHMGFSNMDPADFISDVWLPHVVKNYSNKI